MGMLEQVGKAMVGSRDLGMSGVNAMYARVDTPDVMDYQVAAPQVSYDQSAYTVLGSLRRCHELLDNLDGMGKVAEGRENRPDVPPLGATLEALNNEAMRLESRLAALKQLVGRV